MWQALSIPCNRWNTTFNSRFIDFYKLILFGFDFSKLFFELCESEIINAENGVFTTIHLGPELLVILYCGTLVYESLYAGASRHPTVYREGVLVFPVKETLKSGM